jgi:hypothetical protein
MGISFQQIKVVPHRVRQELTNDLRIRPAPLSIEMCIGYLVNNAIAAEIRGASGFPTADVAG